MERFPEVSWDPLDARVPGWLASAAVTDGARIPYASNFVFLLELQHDDAPTLGYAVYKPGKGENPLWDFPPNLYRREVAAYRLSAALGWELIPPTVEREQGMEYGIGSLQAYIPTDYSCTFFELREEHADVMRRFALFDWLSNNADRKGGHVLKGEGDQLWGIDNGLSFHEEEKLRTVIWDYAGEPIDARLLEDVEGLIPRLESGGDAADALSGLLSEGEIEVLRLRAALVLEQGRLPEPPTSRRSYPWPLV
ncbi:MAG: SCO1664 family protein [Chloroflexi bacterium]|nr:SCO1664 family protein [Chloroflexota bacterium]MYI04051.1 SCO1664 family protein [Chloroflexota bacterium]